MLTLAVGSFILAYLFIYAGFSHLNSDGTVVTPLDLIRKAIRGN